MACKSAISYHLSVTRVATQKDIQQNQQCVCCPEAVVRTIVTMLNFKLLKSPSFLLLTLSGFFTMLGIYCPFIFIAQRAEDMKITKEWSTLLITAIGISNTIGRITCGVTSCFPKMDSLVISYVTMFITGGIIIISNYLHTLNGQMTFAILFGFNIG
ncbi:hypothetical protein NQ314_001658 [Rhamnusium bicolor]|uniref:Uncharacterized protein n=1 Tax=Rhamnusium bicolor TaxID=1586634 RepID=A0AAV8ZRS5_9CUCU|nr:hypothetical protein NQ314_001658 [Rhamnusium bicolor]